MIVSLLKTFHLFCTLGLLALTAFSSVKSFTAAPNNTQRDTLSLILIPLAYVTGVFLIYPKGYTFQTQWIIAALTAVPLAFVLLLAKRLWLKGKVAQRIIDPVILVLLILVVHDAVTKSTFF